MGKVIHTKDGRTLMKGPDGRWMSAGGKATQSKKNKEFSQKMFEENLQRRAAGKTVKLKNIIDTANMIEKYNLKSAKYNKDDDSYTVSQSDYDKMYKSAKNKKYIENLKHGGGQMYTHGYLPNPTKKPATQFERDQKLAEKGGKEYEDMMKRREEAVKAASDRAKTSNSFIRKASLQERDRLRKEYEDLAEYAGDEVKRKTPRDSKLAKNKSLSFEKREGYGLNPAEYKLSNGDGISPRSLNPNEGNPTNIKKLKDVPGRTSRHTDEIIVKSNYSGKEYVVTREHYQDTKTGYHRAEVVDIRQQVENKEKAPAKKESFKAKERTDYINNISKLRNNGDKKDEDWRVVRQTLDHAPTGTVMIEKGERGSERQYKKLADGSWEYVTGSYKGEKTDSKTMSMGWAGHTGYSPSIEFTTEKKMAAAKAKAQKLPKFVENAKSPATVVTKTGNQMLLDLGNSDFTAVNVRTLEKQGWKRRGTSDLTWYKNI